MASSAKLVGLNVVNATQKHVTGTKNWVAVKGKTDSVIVEATTAPSNNREEWEQIQWSGGEPVPGQACRRKLSCTTSKKDRIKAALGGVSDYVDVWIIWATIEIRMKGDRPPNAVPFNPTRDNTQKCGAVTYETMYYSAINEAADEYVRTMGASGKVVPFASLSPRGVFAVVETGWQFEREVWSQNWADGKKTNQTNTTWTSDTSRAEYLRLKPDAQDRIYDQDAPNMSQAKSTYETYNNFRQWIKWNDDICSSYSYWYWRARWKLDKDPKRQITLNDLGTGNITLPSAPYYPARE